MAVKWPTQAQKKAKARKDMRLMDEAPKSLPRCYGEMSDDRVEETRRRLQDEGFVVATTDPWGDRAYHFTGLVIWYAPKKWVKVE